MKLVKLLNRICEAINKLVSAAIIALFLVMFIACVVQVFTRYVMNDSAVWTDETARYTFVWAMMLSATSLYWGKGHAVLSFIVDRLPGKLKAVFEIFSEVLVVGIGYVFIKFAGIPMKIASLQKSPALKLPMNAIYIAIPICGAIFMLYAITHIVETFYNAYVRKGSET